MTRIEEIYATVLPYMKDNDVNDTPENREIFLRGLLASWMEDDTKNIEKTFYEAALCQEIFKLRRKIKWNY